MIEQLRYFADVMLQTYFVVFVALIPSAIVFGIPAVYLGKGRQGSAGSKFFLGTIFGPSGIWYILAFSKEKELDETEAGT